MRHIITSALVALGMVVGGAGAASAAEDATQGDDVCVPSAAVEAVAPTREGVVVPAWTETIEHDAVMATEYKWVATAPCTRPRFVWAAEQPDGYVAWLGYDGAQPSQEVEIEAAWTETVEHPATMTSVVTEPGSPFIPAVTCVAGPAGETGPAGPSGPQGVVGARGAQGADGVTTTVVVAAAAAVPVAVAPAFAG